MYKEVCRKRNLFERCKVPENVTVARAREGMGFKFRESGREPSLACGGGGRWSCVLVISGDPEPLSDIALAKKHLERSWKAIEYIRGNYNERVYLGVGADL